MLFVAFSLMSEKYEFEIYSKSHCIVILKTLYYGSVNQ